MDGGVTIQRFLQAGLIQRLIITRIAVLLGEGIPLFAHSSATSFSGTSRRGSTPAALSRVSMWLPPNPRLQLTGATGASSARVLSADGGQRNVEFNSGGRVARS